MADINITTGKDETYTWNEAGRYDHWLDSLDGALTAYENRKRWYVSSDRKKIAAHLRKILNAYHNKNNHYKDPKFTAQTLHTYLLENPIEESGFRKNSKKSFLHAIAQTALKNYKEREKDFLTHYSNDEEKKKSPKISEEQIEELKKIEVFKNQLSERNQQFEEVTKLLNSVQNKLTVAESSLKELEKAKKQNQSLQQELDEKTKIIEQKDQELDVIKAQTQKIATELANLTEETSELRINTMRMKENISLMDIINNQSRKLQEENTQHTDKFNNLSNKVDKLQLDNQQLRHEIATYQENEKKLQAENKSLKDTNTELTEKKNKAEQALFSLQMFLLKLFSKESYKAGKLVIKTEKGPESEYEITTTEAEMINDLKKDQKIGNGHVFFEEPKKTSLSTLLSSLKRKPKSESFPAAVNNQQTLKGTRPKN